MLRMNSSTMVKPAEPTPNVHLWLHECDQIKPLTHAPTIYFYRNPGGDSVASAFDTLKNSLAQALVRFYPLAGRLDWMEGTDRLQLHCNEMGVQLLEAESDAELADFGDFCPTPDMRKLVPIIDCNTNISEQPVLLLQLTRFKCGGLSLGVLTSHVVTDGLSALLFFNSWAKIAREGMEKFDVVPYIDRTVFYKGDPVAIPRFHHQEFDPLPLLIGQHDNKTERIKETTVAMFKLTREHVEKLQQRANAGNTARAYSRYETLAGHIWRCACEARKHNQDQLTKVQIAVDSRNRLHPPSPPNYFGNGIVVTMPMAKSGDLSAKPLGFACSKIREAVKKVDDEYIKSAIDFLSSQSDLSPFRSPLHSGGSTMGKFYGNPNLAVTSWMGLPIDGADFGWGKPIHMGPASVGFDGKFFIIPGHDEDGSYVIPMRLQVAHMDEFNKFFHDI